MEAAGSSGAPMLAGSRREQRKPGGARDDSDDASVEAPYCRICHMTEEESSQPLIRPCRCSGSIGHAHPDCILQWLRHATQDIGTEWHCDVCRQPLRVRLGGGRSPGLAYFGRPLDVLEDHSFDAPGLVAVLFVSQLQILVTSLGRVAAHGAHGAAAVISQPLPQQLGEVLRPIITLPAALLELSAYIAYVVLFGLKAAVAWSGPGWRPADWGDLGEERMGLLLGAVADNLGFALGVRLDSFLVLAIYFSGSHLCSVIFGQTVLGVLSRRVLIRVSVGAQVLLAIDPLQVSAPQDLHPALGAALPGPAAAALQRVHGLISTASLMLNIVAILRLFKRAFLDRRPVPVEVLPAETETLMRTSESQKRRKRRRVSEVAAGEGE